MKHAKVPIIFALCFWPLAEVLSGEFATQSFFGSLNLGNDFRIVIGAGNTVCFKPKTVPPKSDPDISVVKFRLIRVEESFAVESRLKNKACRRYRFHATHLNSQCYCTCTTSSAAHRKKCEFPDHPGNTSTVTPSFVKEERGRLCRVQGDLFGGSKGDVGQETACCSFRINPGKIYQAIKLSNSPSYALHVRISHLGREQDIHLLARGHSFTQARASLGAGMNMTIRISPYHKSQLTSSEVPLPGWIVVDESARTILSPPSGKSIINSYNEWSPFKQGWLRPKHNKKGLEMANTEKIKGLSKIKVNDCGGQKIQTTFWGASGDLTSFQAVTNLKQTEHGSFRRESHERLDIRISLYSSVNYTLMSSSAVVKMPRNTTVVSVSNGTTFIQVTFYGDERQSCCQAYGTIFGTISRLSDLQNNNSAEHFTLRTNRAAGVTQLINRYGVGSTVRVCMRSAWCRDITVALGNSPFSPPRTDEPVKSVENTITPLPKDSSWNKFLRYFDVVPWLEGKLLTWPTNVIFIAKLCFLCLVTVMICKLATCFKRK